MCSMRYLATLCTWDLCWTRVLVGMQGELTVGMELGQGALLGPA